MRENEAERQRHCEYIGILSRLMSIRIITRFNYIKNKWDFTK